MKKNIEALWMGRPLISSISEEDQRRYSEINSKARKNYDRLENLLNQDQVALLHEYLSLQANLNEIERKNAFVNGFSLGVKLIVEGVEE